MFNFKADDCNKTYLTQNFEGRGKIISNEKYVGLENLISNKK